MEKNQPIRIAQIVGDMIDGGVDNLVLNYYRFIDHSKYQFDFIASDLSTDLKKDEIEAMGGRVFVIPSYRELKEYKKALSCIFAQNNYLIVHSHMNTLSVVPLRIAKKNGIPIRVAHSHSAASKKEFLKTLVKYTLRPFSRIYATNLMACTEFAGAWLFGKKSVATGKVHILRNAVNIDIFLYSDKNRKLIRSLYGIPAGAYVIGNVGRFVEQKNQSFLLRSFAVYSKKNPFSYLLIVGDGPLKDELLSLSKKLSIDKKVIFAGSHPDVSPFYSAMDCFSFPSMYEGFGMAALEAQINGLPVIVSQFVPKDILINNSSFCEAVKKNSEYDWSKDYDSMRGKRKINNEDLHLFKGGPYDIQKCAHELTDYYQSQIDAIGKLL